MSTEINWAAIAVLLFVLAALRGRIGLALIAVLVPIALAEWNTGPEAGIQGWVDLLQVPSRVGPMGLFALVLLALLPTSSPGTLKPSARGA